MTQPYTADETASLIEKPQLEGRCLDQLLSHSSFLQKHPEYQDNREIVLASIAYHSDSFQFAADSLKKEADFVLAAVQKNGPCLKHAHDSLKNDETIVLAAVQQHGWSLYYAAEALKSNKIIVLAAIQQNGSSLEFAAESLRGDPKIVWAAVEQNASALRFVAKSLRNDPEFVLSVFEKNPVYLKYFKFGNNDIALLLKVIQKNPVIFGHIKAPLKSNAHFIQQVIQKLGYRAYQYAPSDIKKYHPSFIKEVRRISDSLILREHRKRFILGMGLGLIVSIALIGVVLVFGLNLWIWRHILPLILSIISEIAGGFFISKKYPSALYTTMMADKKAYLEREDTMSPQGAQDPLDRKKPVISGDYADPVVFSHKAALSDLAATTSHPTQSSSPFHG